MLRPTDFKWVAFEDVQEVGKCGCRSIGHRRGEQRRRSQEPTLSKPGKHVAWTAEEGGESEGEVVGRVAGSVEEITRDLELCVADSHIDGGCEKLCGESRHCRIWSAGMSTNEGWR